MNPAYHRPMWLALSFVVFLVGLDTVAAQDDSSTPVLVSVRKIWDKAPHNAFTDLVRWNGKFYCAFREGEGHAGDKGNLRIIESVDGEEWTSAGLLTDPEFDLRDAALTVMPDGRLMVLGGVQKTFDGQRRTGTFVSFSADGREYSEPRVVVEPGRWLWRVTVLDDTAYGVSYGAPDRQAATALHKSTDGHQFELVTESMLDDGERPTEARIRFDASGTAYCLQRRDGSTKNSAMLGIAKSPYEDWEWHDLGIRLGGPNFMQIPNGQWIASGRLYDGGARTELLHLDLEAKKMTPILRLPSGADTSYPGMVWHDDTLWVSYYSGHEGRTSIYLAEVRFEDKANEPAPKQAVIDIGTRQELFVDDYLLASKLNVEHRLHHPQPAENVVEFDHPWEGAFCGYVTILMDGDLYRMYYRGLPKSGRDGTAAEVTCYAESTDGIHWQKPNVGIYEVDGSLDNNIVLKDQTPASHNFSPFIDTNPAAPEAERYKALGGTAKGLIAFTSPDGLKWTRLREAPVFTKGIFDSQNVSFWSEAEQQYVCYFRTWTETGYGGFRTVSRTTSDDFIDWTDPVQMTFGDTRYEHLYTNQTHPYFRAPHLYVGVAARFMPGRRVLTAREANRVGVDPRYFGDISDAVLLTSRGGDAYDRTFMESLVRPGIGLENWVSRTNYPALGIVPTGEREMSMYIQKNYGQPTSHVRRYTMRIDGFASLEAGYDGGEFTTRLLSFPAASDEEIEAKRQEIEANAEWLPAQPTMDNPIVGGRSLRFTDATYLELPKTQSLGEKVTLSIHLRNVPAGHRRLFSAYNGGSTVPRELILDVNSAANIDTRGSIRFFYDDLIMGAEIEKIGAWNADSETTHHVAVTWNDGIAKLYFDGKLVATGGERGKGPIELAQGNLRLGEDYPPTSLTNEPLLGCVDDVIVIRRVLSDDEISALFERGSESIPLESLSDEDGVVLNMEGHETTSLLNAIGQTTINLATGNSTEDRELALNMSTSAAGSVRVELLDEHNQPYPGYSLADSDELIGDQIDRVATWKGNSDISALAEKPVRIRFVMKDANLFALQIR